MKIRLRFVCIVLALGSVLGPMAGLTAADQASSAEVAIGIWHP